MKLLTPTAAQAESRGQRMRIAARDKEAADVLADKRRLIAETDARFHEMIASQQDRWAKEESEHEERVRERTQELHELEEKKRAAMKPLDKIRMDLESSLKGAESSKALYEEKSAECDRAMEKFESRLDEVKDQEQINERRSILLDSREKGIKMQEEETKQRARLVSEGIESLRVERQKFEVSCRKKDEEYAARKLYLNAKEASLDERESRLENREQQITIKEYMYSSPINESPVRTYGKS